MQEVLIALLQMHFLPGTVLSKLHRTCSRPGRIDVLIKVQALNGLCSCASSMTKVHTNAMRRRNVGRM